MTSTHAARPVLVSSAEGPLAASEFGDPTGFPLLQLHSTPGSRLQRFFAEDVYARMGVRVILFDRPGYGRSPRRRGRSVADGARDVVTVADAFGIDRFALLGASGGAPYALATAATFADRVAAVTVVVPIMPRVGDIAAWCSGMEDAQRAEMTAAFEGEEQSSMALEKAYAGSMAVLAAGGVPDTIFPPARTVAREWMPEAFAQGVTGMVDDDLAYVRPWGFAIEDVRGRPTIWAAEDDTLAPFTHATWLADRIEGATLVPLTGGHMSWLRRFQEILTELCARARA